MTRDEIKGAFSDAILKARTSLDQVELLAAQHQNTYGGRRLAHLQQLQHDVLSGLIGLEHAPLHAVRSLEAKEDQPGRARALPVDLEGRCRQVVVRDVPRAGLRKGLYIPDWDTLLAQRGVRLPRPALVSCQTPGSRRGPLHPRGILARLQVLLNQPPNKLGSRHVFIGCGLHERLFQRERHANAQHELLLHVGGKPRATPASLLRHWPLPLVQGQASSER